MSLQISMIIFSEKPVIQAEKVQSALNAKWPTIAEVSDMKYQDGLLSFRMGTVDIALVIMPGPIPWSDLEGPCATSMLWPKAADVIREHTHHAIVTANGELSPIELSTALTQVTAAVAASSPEALGVFWTNAALVLPKDLFVGMAVETLPVELPLPLWVDFRVGWSDKATQSAGFTTGLAKLGLFELETQYATEPPSELYSRFESIAEYLLESGPVIKDGDTIGASASEKIRVAYTKSLFGAEGTVIRLVYEAA